MRILFRHILMFALLLLGGAFHGSLLAQEEEAAEAEAPTEGKYKIPLEPFHFALLKRGRVVGQVNLTLVLELADGREYEDINRQVPRIRSDISIALTDLARQQFDVDRPIDPDLVSAYLTPFLDYRLGADRVEVYVQKAIIDPK